MNKKDIYNDIRHDIVPKLLDMISFINKEYSKDSNSVILDSERDDIAKAVIFLFRVVEIERSIDSFSEGSDTQNVFRSESEKEIFEAVKNHNEIV